MLILGGMIVLPQFHLIKELGLMRYALLLIVLITGWHFPTPLLAQQWLPFVIPWDDATSGVATDVSHLNNKALPQLILKDGQIVEPDSGKRIRFWATNFCFEQNFPEHDAADKVAAHLAKSGINLVRLHHFDSQMAMHNGASIWDRTKQKKVIDPERLDRLHYLISALANNGIYVDMNLKVSKEINKIDGAAIDSNQTSTSVATSFQKVIDRFDPFLIDHQKGYAKQLMTTPNPYRNQLAPANDPAVVMVEINNENAAGGWPGEGPGSHLHTLPQPYATQIKTLWTSYLRKKYGTQKQMLAQWVKDLPTPGEDILYSVKDAWWVHSPANGSEMTAEVQSPSQSSVFHIHKTSGTDWHAQATVTPPTLQTGETYTLSFDAFASAPRPMGVTLNRGGPTYANQGLAGTVQLTTKQTHYRLTFSAGAAPDKFLVLQLGAAAGVVTVSNMTLQTGIVGGKDFTMTDSIDRGLVSLPANNSLPNIQRDWQLFVGGIDIAFAQQMRVYLRKDLGVKALITDTQMGWGGSSSWAREKDSDFADVHAYWQHPSFGSGKWDPNNWTIDQKSLVLDALCKGNFGTLGELAMQRMANKPFTVSEYDHPSPNIYLSEAYGLIASFASLQDWDAVFTFGHGSYGKHARTDQILSFFDNAANPAKWAFAPSAALIFRAQLIEPLADVATLHVPDDVYGTHWNSSAPWDAAGTMPSPLKYRIQTVGGSDQIRMTKTKTASSSTLSLNDSRYTVTAPKAFVTAGILGGKTLNVGSLAMKLDAFDNNFAAMTLVPLDNKNLDQSQRLLLTLVGQAENQNMGWNKQRTSVGNNWGHGPIQIQRITGTLTGRPDLTIYPLLPNGERCNATTGLTGDTVWYELRVN